MSFDLDWNGDELVAALSEPFRMANEALGRKFQQEITSNKWPWPTGDSPRDIVDLGQLRDSYDSQPGKAGRNPIHDHTWSTEYAMAVHEGARYRDGRTMPARPWTKEPLEGGVLERAFEALAEAELRKVQ